MDLKQFAAQLRHPTGNEGKEVGGLMNKGNQVINSWAVHAAALKENDYVLEIGMGNGAFVKDILDVYPTIKYCGIDYSATMVDEAKLLNKKYIHEQRASFLQCDAKKLPFEDAVFSKIISVNTIYFWEEPHLILTELNRVLQRDGKVVFAIRTKATMAQMPFTEYGFIKYSLSELSLLLAEHFTIIDASERSEPTYLFNNKPMLLENAIVVCEKR